MRGYFLTLFAGVLEIYDRFCDRFVRNVKYNENDWPQTITSALCYEFSGKNSNNCSIYNDPEWFGLPENGGVRVKPEIINGALSARDSGLYITAAYISTKLNFKASKIRSEISFGPGLRGGCAAIIFTRTIQKDRSDISFIVDDGSIHLAFSNTKVSVGLFKARDFFVLKTFYLPIPLPRNGQKFVIGADISGRNMRIIAPGLVNAIVQHDRIDELHGEYLTLEPFWKKGQCKSKFHRVIIS